MKSLNVLSWGGGTQSTALMLLFLKGEIKDRDGKPIQLDYIMFANTKNESSFVYKQIYKVIKYVKDVYNKDIIISSKNKIFKNDEYIKKMILNDKLLNYRNSEYADLLQSHILYFDGILDSIDVMPLWVRKKDGSIGKTPFKACTFAYKIDQIMKDIRILENVKRFTKNSYNINFYIGYSVDEISRVKDNPKSYCNNYAPLVNMNWTKNKCIDYVHKELGFIPVSSVCNMCYANDFDRVYKIYKEDINGWKRLIELDSAMENKPNNHRMKEKCFMFRWQSLLNQRLKDIDMEKLSKSIKTKNKQLNIFDTEQAMACMGGCFL